MSVVDVCWPLLLHSVCPCLISAILLAIWFCLLSDFDDEVAGSRWLVAHRAEVDHTAWIGGSVRSAQRSAATYSRQASQVGSRPDSAACSRGGAAASLSDNRKSMPSGSGSANPGSSGLMPCSRPGA